MHCLFGSFSIMSLIFWVFPPELTFSFNIPPEVCTLARLQHGNCSVCLSLCPSSVSLSLRLLSVSLSLFMLGLYRDLFLFLLVGVTAFPSPCCCQSLCLGISTNLELEHVRGQILYRHRVFFGLINILLTSEQTTCRPWHPEHVTLNL